MAYDIGARVGIDGEKEFRAQISRINKDYKSMGDYLKTLDKSMELNGKSMEGLAAKSNGLRQQLAMQQEKQKALAEALEKVRAKYGDGSQQVLRFEGAMLDVNQTINALNSELNDTQDEMDRLARGIDDVGDAAGKADDKVLGFGDVLKAGIASDAILNAAEEVGEVLRDLGEAAVTAAADVKASNSQFEQTFRELEGPARRALDGISADIKMASSRLQGAYTDLYAFTKNVGGDSTQALGIAERAIRAAADSAAYYDRTVEDATETLQSFLKGNYENDAALGIAATETTRNAKANELYAKSFKDLSEAQKVDVLLSMVEAGNAASGALGAAAREADEWTNVTGELSEATRLLLAQLGSPVLTGVTPIIRSITDGIRDMINQASYQTLSQEITTFRDGLAAARAELDDSNASMAATSDLALRYTNRLDELKSAGLDTAESQREYRQVVELLNALMPELNLTIEENTGLLSKNTYTIRDNIRGLKDQAEQQAKQAYFKKILDQHKQAYEAQYTAQMKLMELEERKQLLLEQGADCTIEYTEAMLNSTAGFADMNSGLSELDRELLKVQAEETALRNEMVALDATLADTADALEAAQRGYEGLSESEQQAAEAAAQQAKVQAELDAAYAETVQAARESIDSQIGLFEELSTKNDLSAQKIIQNWESQRKAFDNYADNLKKAVDMGLDEALVRQLSDGSQQSMQILNEFVSGTQADVDKINAAFQGLSAAKDHAAGAMAEVAGVLDAAFDQMAGDAEDSGEDIVDGAIAGIKSNTPRYAEALAAMARRGQNRYNEEWVIKSPSHWMGEASDYIVDGGVNQVQARIRDMEQAMEDLAHSGQVAYQRQLAADADSYPTMTAGAVGYTTNAVTNNRSVSLGGVTVVVNAQLGQDPTALAYEVADVLGRIYDSEVSALG